MTDDLINTVLFYFVCGSMDAFLTALIIFAGIGVEGNPVWNWMQPKEVLVVGILLGNLLLCFSIMLIIYVTQRWNPIYKTIIKFGLYGEGLGRIVFGAIPGIVLMKAAGWF